MFAFQSVCVSRNLDDVNQLSSGNSIDRINSIYLDDAKCVT
jgi:hypothetical protein